MTDPTRTTVSSSGIAIFRQRPSFLLMILRLRVAELTMERSWANLQVEIHSTSQLLKRLGAVRVEVGEPLFDEQKERNPLARMQADAARAMAMRMKGKSEEPADAESMPSSRESGALRLCRRNKSCFWSID